MIRALSYSTRVYGMEEYVFEGFVVILGVRMHGEYTLTYIYTYVFVFNSYKVIWLYLLYCLFYFEGFVSWWFGLAVFVYGVAFF